MFHIWEWPSMCSLLHHSMKLACHKQHHHPPFLQPFPYNFRMRIHIPLWTIGSIFGGLGRRLSQDFLPQNLQSSVLAGLRPRRSDLSHSLALHASKERYWTKCPWILCSVVRILTCVFLLVTHLCGWHPGRANFLDLNSVDSCISERTVS